MKLVSQIGHLYFFIVKTSKSHFLQNTKIADRFHSNFFFMGTRDVSLLSSKCYFFPKFPQMKTVIKNEIHLLYKRSENVTKWHFHPTLASHKVCLSIQNIFFSLALSNLGMLAIYSWQNNL